MYPNKFDKPYRNTNKIDEKKVTDLFIMINNMNTHEIKQFSLIEQIPLTIVDNEGNNLIHKVLLNTDKTESQRLNMIQYLYNENVNPNAPNSSNTTPLHIACMKQFSTIVDFLIQIGVNTNYQDNNGNTPLHRLFAGKIKLENKTNKIDKGLIIPKQKKMDKTMIEGWKKERSKIWNVIKSSPYLKAIEDTMVNTISVDNQIAKDIVKDFQQDLLTFNLKDNGTGKTDTMKELKKFRDSSVNRFKNEIKGVWNNFQPIDDIVVHRTEPHSWPPNDPSGLSVVKNADSDVYLKNDVDSNLNDLVESLKPLDINKKIDINDIYGKIKNEFEQTNPTYNKPNDIMDVFYNKFKHNDAIDFASDIINWENHTFIGGSREVSIIEIPDIATVHNILYDHTAKELVRIMAYTLVDSDINHIIQHINTSANLDIYDYVPQLPILQLTQFDQDIIQYIVMIIENNLTPEIEDILIDNINSLKTVAYQYSYLIRLINIRNKSNTVSWLYTFATTYCSIREYYTEKKYTNMTVSIHQAFMYLITAYSINKRNDIKMAIFHVFKPRIILDEIFNKNGFGVMPNDDIGSMYSCWIYCLLNENRDFRNMLAVMNANTVNIIGHISALPINMNFTIDLQNIIIYTFNYFNDMMNIDITPTWLSLELDPSILDKLSESEILCSMIIKYYNKMDTKPLLQNIVDTISLIRYKMINSSIPLPDSIKEIICNRLIRLYEPPFEKGTNLNNTMNPFDVNNNMHTHIDPVLPYILNRLFIDPDIKTRLEKYFTLFSLKDPRSIEMFLISEYSLPSKIYFYLAKGFNAIDIIKNNDMKHFLLKKIEASHLGLCFMGILDNINLPELPKKGTPSYNQYFNLLESDNTHYDLFYYYNKHSTDGYQKYFYINRRSTLFRPPTTFSYYNLLNQLGDKLIDINNMLNGIVSSVFTNFKIFEKTSQYSSIITYSYPIYCSLSNFQTNIDNMNKMYLCPHPDEEFNLPNKIEWKQDVCENLKLTPFNIKEFESNINTINGYLYLYYYLNSIMKKQKLNIPKFIYHQLGTSMTIFDNKDVNLVYPSNAILPDKSKIVTNTDTLDMKTGENNIMISSYMNVINQINNRMYYIHKEILSKSFVGSKKSKLPPSLRASNILDEFYKLNTIKLITTDDNLKNVYNSIDKVLIRESNLKDDVLRIQKYYIGSKIVEELVSMYLKNKLQNIAMGLYNTLIRNTIPVIPDMNIEKIFTEDYKFDVDISERPPSDLLELYDTTAIEEKVLMNFYPLSNTELLKDFFYIYPNDYFNTSLLLSKYTLEINKKIIETMLESNANIFIHNNEMSSPLTMLIKNNYYDGIELIKTIIGVTHETFENSNTLEVSSSSPYKYLLEIYKSHLNKFQNIKQFVTPQFNEIKQIIQSNESYTNNVLLNLELSFMICNYLTQQFLTENMIKSLYKYTPEFTTDMKTKIPDYMIDMRSVYYKEIIEKLKIPSKNEGILLELIQNDYIKDLDKLDKKRSEYSAERLELSSQRKNTSIVENKIQNIIQKHDELMKDLTNIIKIKSKIDPIKSISIQMVTRIPHIIKRYDTMLNKMNRDTKLRGSYIEGWKILLKDYIEESPDIMLSRILKEENKSYKNKFSDNTDTINKYYEYYEHMNNVSRSYFETLRYVNDNKVLKFVYDMLLHLTQNILCYSIELIIRKLLYQSFINTEYFPAKNKGKDAFIDKNNMIDYILSDEIKDYLYNTVADKFVRNSVNIFEDIMDKESYDVQTTGDIINSFIDFMETNSSIEINKNILTILKTNIVGYFENIVTKTIINWNICAENVFIYTINHYRIIRMIKNSMN